MLDAAIQDMTAELEGILDEAAFVDPRTIPTRFSLLKLMAECPAKYLHACQQPQDDSLAARLGALNPGVKTRSEALRFGTAVHELLLGDEKKIAVYTAGKRAGKNYEAFAKDAAERGCIEILNAREHAIARGVVDAIKRHPVAYPLLADGTIVEKKIEWSWMDKACRSTPDARTKKHLVDLKTAKTAHPGAFVKNGAALYYHAQAAFYLQALDAASEPVPADCYVIAVEKTPPYPVTVMRFDAESLEVGAKLIRLWFEQLLQCESANRWPEYVPAPAIADFTLAQQGGFAVEIDGERVEV